MANNVETYFYKYTVTYYEEVDEKDFELKTASGVVAAKTFNSACDKLTDYYGEESIEKMNIEFIEDMDVIEWDELQSNFEKTENDNEKK